MPYAFFTKCHSRRTKKREKSLVPTSAVQWEQIMLGRTHKEQDRHRRNFRLGREYHPMPGYPILLT